MLKDILLVTRNYEGTCEENFITTFDEFAKKFCAREDEGYKETLRTLIDMSKPYAWEATYYERGSVSYDLRQCQNENDLVAFLEGKYNDSIEKMEDRNPGASYGYWHWENRAGFFSEKAIKQVCELGDEFKAKLLNVMPDFPFEARKSSLADLINDANTVRESREKNIIRDFSRGQEALSL